MLRKGLGLEETMKKRLLIASLFVFLMMSIAGCGQTASPEQQNDKNTVKATDIPEVKPTPTETPTPTLTPTPTTTPTPTDTPMPTATPTPQRKAYLGEKLNHWDYNETENDQDSITGYFPGEFTASVISDGEQVVAAQVVYSEGYYYFLFAFAEHDGSELYHVYDFSSGETFKLVAKTGTGKQKSIRAHSYDGAYGVFVLDDLDDGFIELLRDNEKLSFELTVANPNKESSETFNFSLNNKGFSQMINKLIAKNSFSEGDVLSKLEVVNEYKYSDAYGFSHAAFVVMRNTSKYTVQLEAKTKFYDKAGELIGYASASERAVGPNEEVCFRFSNGEDFDHYEITWSASEEKYFRSVCSNISLEVSKAKNKAIIEAKNNGDVSAQFVEYYALFLSGGEVVGYGWGYLTDNDSEIKPGKTEMREATCYASFDTVKVYITGRGAK